MADYKKNNRPGGFRPNSFGKKPFASKEMFDAECNSCHNRCQVPFRPNGKKPVYCSNCFTKDDSKAPPRGASSYHTVSQARPRVHVPGNEANDRQIQALKKQIEGMNETLLKLVASVDALNRANDLAREVQKHMPAEKKTAKAAKSAVKTVKKVAKKK